MSAALLGFAFEADMPSASAKLVLLKLVDCCNDEGKRIYPAVGTVARQAKCSTRQVQLVLVMFCRIGLLRKVRAGGSGPGSTSTYELDIPTLKRLCCETWGAVSGALNGSKSEAESGGESSDKGENKGEVISPLNPVRVNLDANKGEIALHPTPQEEPLNIERESASARTEDQPQASRPEPRDQKRLGEKGIGEKVDDPQLLALIRQWPGALAENLPMIRRLWDELSSEQRGLAVQGAQACLAESQRPGRKHSISLKTYLVGKNWQVMTPELADKAQSQAFCLVKPWSREWWAVMIRRIHRGDPVKFSFSEALSGKSIGARPADLPAADEIERFRPYRADNPVLQNWRPWFARAGCNLPEWDDSIWVFLPGETPASAVL